MATAAQHGPPRRSIRRLLIRLLLIVLVPVLLVQAAIYYRWYQTRLSDENETNLEVARAVATAFDGHVDDIRREEAALGHGLLLLEPFDPQRANAFLAQARSQYPTLRTLLWTDPRGQVLASSGPSLSGADLSGAVWLSQIAGGQETVVTNLTRSRKPDDDTFFIATGIRDTGGALRGVMLAQVDPKRLSDVLSIKRGRGGAFALIDPSGWVVYRYPPVRMNHSQRDWVRLYPQVRQALRGKESTGTVLATFEDRRRMVAEVPIRSIGWVAGAGRAEDEVLAPLRSGLIQNTTVMLLVALLGITLAVGAAGSIIAPLARLRAHSRAVGEGEFGQRVEPSGPAELLELAGAFNRMAEELQARELERQRADQEIAWLASFPQQNPLPVMEVEESGRVHYANPAAQRLLVGLEQQGIEHPWLADFGEVVTILGEQGGQFTRDVAIGDAWYQQAFFGTTEGRVRVYGTDLTTRKQAEDALRESQAALQASHQRLEQRVEERTAELQSLSRYARGLIEASLDPLVTISPEGKITDVNQATELVTGVPRDRLIGTNFSGYFTEPDKANAGYRHVLAHGEVRDYPLTIRHVSGRMTDVLYSATVYRNEAGQLQGVFAAARDVTDRKRAEQAVMAERQRFNNVLEALPAYVILLTPDHHVALANRFFRERFGEFHGRRCFEHLFGRSEPCETCETYRVLETKAPHHWEWTGPDGRDYDISDFPFTDTDGSPLILEVGLDITERKRAEAELRAHREHLEELVTQRTAELDAQRRLLDTIVENTDTRLAYLNLDLRYMRVNRAYCVGTHFTQEGIVGLSYQDVEGSSETKETLTEVLTTGEIASFEETVRQPGPSPKNGTYWDWSAIPIRNEEWRVVGLLISAVDVTSQVQARERMLEAERARARMAETLAAEVNHRVKNNLAMAAGLLQMQIASQPEETPVTRALGSAITRLHAFSVVHEQLLSLETQYVDVLQALRRISEISHDALSATNAEAMVEGEPTLLPSKVATTLCIVANELMTNAIKHGAPKPGERLEIRVRLTEQDGKLHLSVWNSGKPVRRGFDVRKEHGIGLRLVHSLAVGQYGGSFALRPYEDGTLAEIVLDEARLRSA